ncbi:hypothetical protein LIER_31782 [Lithospermum erythrorhizon]|uniref:Uncharacterized protein n=1 Tax=Lithospermum erythrorhizon TaxID=34254 RepID=A0AAV3RSQ8_LITER
MAATKRIRAQMELGSTSQGIEGPTYRDICTLEILEESPKKGRPYVEIRSVPTLRVEHEAMLIRDLREYQNIFAWEPKDILGVDPAMSVHRTKSSKRSGPSRRRRGKPSAKR